MSQKLFGTDGIRGKAGKFPITPDVVLKVGQALGLMLKKQATFRKYPLVVIGKDTRVSGYMVEQALASGLNSVGVRVHLMGPMPTPGIGFLAQNMRADAGIIISASHNAFYDNGIKIFGADGFKISTEMEVAIEYMVENQDLNKELAVEKELGRTKRIDDALGRYIVYAKNSFPLELTLDNKKIVLDSSHGAAYKVAPVIFEELGAEVIDLSNKPNGFNINHNSGALHPESCAQAVLDNDADFGITLDGDADRVILIDEEGEVLDGDRILASCAIYLKSLNKLNNNTVVSTLMSNMALDEFLKEHDINVVRTGVGDRKVVEEMRRGDYSLGGEQSGHIIFLDHSTTGDGIVAALKVIEASLVFNKPLSFFKNLFKDMPQILENIAVSSKPPLVEMEGYKEVEEKALALLQGKGRVLVRYSGTESLVRVLVEGPDSEINQQCVNLYKAFFK